MKLELREYIEDGRSPFARWFAKLPPANAARLDRYLRRMAHGNLGDSKSVGGGVNELRVNYGPGYRIYYGRRLRGFGSVGNPHVQLPERGRVMIFLYIAKDSGFLLIPYSPLYCTN